MSTPAAALLARRDELTAQLTDLRREVDDVIAAARDANLDDEHDPEGSTVAYERSRATLLAERAAAELAEVDQALVRLRAGSYGRCEQCGALIDEHRLAARPATRWCIGCARQNESGSSILPPRTSR
jgi:RNA polymerase-binding transcription factor DksA